MAGPPKGAGGRLPEPVTTNGFDPKAHEVEIRRSPCKIAVLSIDVEYDYNGDGSEALDRLPDLLAAVGRTGVPLTAFVEGRLFVERPDLCARLAEAEADLHLHCYDHRRSGDTARSLGAGIDAFESFVGTRPPGYRAKNYRLTEEMFQALVAEGFAWDSSILPGIGRNGLSGRTFRQGDWFVFDGALAELPVASWRPLGIPFTHSWRRALGSFAEWLIERTASLPDLLVYDMHMVDLVQDGRLGKSPEPLWLKGAHAWARWGQKGFEDLPVLAERLRREGYRWTTMTQCHELLTGKER